MKTTTNSMWKTAPLPPPTTKETEKQLDNERKSLGLNINIL